MDLIFIPKSTKEDLVNFGINLNTLTIDGLSEQLKFETYLEIKRDSKVISKLLSNKNITLEGFQDGDNENENSVEATSLKEQCVLEEDKTGYNYISALNTCDLKFTENGLLIICEAENESKLLQVRLAETIEETYGLSRLLESKFYQEL